MFGSKMSPDQLAKLKAKARTSNEIRALAQAAEGLGVTAAERRKAEAELKRRLGSRKAAKQREAALQSAGAKPKGVRGWFS